jgi:Methyltransferase domain
MPWYFAVIEGRHDLQNPTSREKIQLLGEWMGLTTGSTVLDLASGRAGPAIQLAQTFGCRVTCVEKAQEFHDAAQRRVEEAGLSDLIDVVRMDAREFPLGERRFDAALCLGASFIWDGLPGTLEALERTVDVDGSIAVGEPYWRTWPVPPGYDVDQAWAEEYVDLLGTAERLREVGLDLVSIIDSSLDDWDRYESLHWLTGEEWLRHNSNDPDFEEIQRQLDRDRTAYLRWQRELLGWAIFVGRKRSPRHRDG